MEEHTAKAALGFNLEPVNFSVPRETRPGEALFIFKKNLAGIVWNLLSVFENNPATLPQTETILQGQSVSGISIAQLTQVKRFGEGANFLVEAIKNKQFSLDIEFAMRLHGIVGREEALEWGVLRNQQIHINGVTYLPPAAESLPLIAGSGFKFLQTAVDNPVTRAIATFLFMARSQFFFDDNKRTAALMMNGVLLNAGYYPIIILKKTADQFNKKLCDFYNLGSIAEILNYFGDTCSVLYPDV